MSPISHVRRELRVAFSTRAQSVPFRISKWIAIGVLSWLLWDRPWFWWLAIAAILAGLALHFFWRYKTRGWTQPWGGWNDLE